MRLHERIAALERAIGRPNELAQLLQREGISEAQLKKIVRCAIAECEGAGDTQAAAELRAVLPDSPVAAELLATARVIYQRV